MRTTLVCERQQVREMLRLLNRDLLQIERIYTNIDRGGVYPDGEARIPAMPAPELLAAEAGPEDVCVLVRRDHDPGLIDRLVARGFSRRRIVDLDARMLFVSAPGLLSAAHVLRQARLRWRGFLVGLSYFRAGVDSGVFGHEIANFANDSQDLPYDAALVEKVLLPSGQPFEYAVLGLAPYSFDFDCTRTGEAWRFIRYFPTLREEPRLADAFDVPLDQLFAPAIYELPARFDPETVTRESFGGFFNSTTGQNFPLERAFEAPGKAVTWRERRFPATQAVNTACLARSVDLCRAAGLTVFIVTPPVTRLYREAYGQERPAEFRARIGEEVAKGGVHFGDFFAETDYDSTHFFDGDHLNPAGAARFSAELKAFIDARLSG